MILDPKALVMNSLPFASTRTGTMFKYTLDAVVLVPPQIPGALDASLVVT